MKQEPFQDEKIRVDGFGHVDRMVLDRSPSSVGSDDVMGTSECPMHRIHLISGSR